MRAIIATLVTTATLATYGLVAPGPEQAWSLGTDERASATSLTAAALGSSQRANDERRAEDVFLALFFMQGKEARDLYAGGAISKMAGFDTAYKAVNTEPALALSASVISDLKATDPKYFQRFGKKIASGNPYIVEKLIAKSRADISATPTVTNQAAKTATYVPGETGVTCGVTVVVAGAFVLVGAVFAAAAAVIWVAGALGQAVAVAETAVKVRNVKSSPQGDQLYQDWVADVTDAYASK